ncbi:hypothetical protein BMR02_15895, partial [Methylococcaceae bacterium HT1]
MDFLLTAKRDMKA